MHLNKIIIYTVLEAFTLTITIFTTYYMWNNFEIDESAKIAYAYTHKKEKISLHLENNLTELISIEDNEALNETNNLIIKIQNPSQIKKQYALYFRVNNNTTVDKSYLKMNIGSVNKYIKDLENYKKELNSYYLIKNGIINPSETITETLYIWLSEDAPKTEYNKILNFDLYLEEM